jgi:vacuolar-type H+-ATPase subunit H
VDNGIDKKALFKMKTEPYLKPISDLGVGFYNLDENTAILQFQLTNNSGPLMISDNNVKSYAYFESKNGSASDVIDLEIIDNYNGIVQITLPKDFLQASTDTKVTGQVYIGVKNISGKPEYNEVAVFREFDFEVKDALINKISSFTKIEYIRMFSQLKLKIEQQVVDIQEAIANGADYVAEMKSVLQKGIETLNAIVSNGKTDIQTYITQAKSDLDNTKDDAIDDITTTSNNAKTSVTETAENAVKTLNSKADETTEHVDSKVAEFNQTVADNGFLSPEILDEELEELEWQKYKLTEDDGTAPYTNLSQDLNNLHDLKPGFYYTVGTPGLPSGVSTSGITEVIYRTGGLNKIIKYIPYNSNKLFLKRFYQGWTDWKELTNNQTDTGWIPFNLVNGAKTNTAYPTRNGFESAYRIIKNGDVTERYLRINGSNVDHTQVIAQLPSTFAKNVHTGFIRTPLAHNGSSIIIETTGEVRVYIENYDSWQNSESKYIYGEVRWID